MTTASRASVPKPKGRVTKRMWGGFSAGKLCYEIEHYRGFKTAAVFFNRATARAGYQDVRPVTVTWSSPLKRAKDKRRGS